MKMRAKKPLALFLAFALCFSANPLKTAATPQADNVVINQAYGGGGNSGATYKQDFIELYNPTASDISLEGWSVQYASVGGSSYLITPLNGTIRANGFYLIQQANGAGGTVDLPEPDAQGSVNMGATGFKIALVSSTAAISDKFSPGIIDFVGAGSANQSEDTPAPAPSNTTSIVRAVTGVDTDRNNVDFITAEPNPRNSAYGVPVSAAEAPEASPASGAKVLSGQKVTFTSTTTGASFEYTLTDPEGGAGFSPVPSDGIEMTGNPGDIIQLYVKTVKQGLADSTVRQFTYTVKDASEIEDPIPDGSLPAGVLNINQALEAADSETADITVAGQLVYRFGNADTVNTAILQDVIDGKSVALQIYNDALTSFNPGDIVQVTGKKTTYRDVPQLQNISASSLLTPAASTVLMTPRVFDSISELLALKDSLLSQTVLLKNVTLGTYSSGGSTLITDSLGATLPIYRGASFPDEVLERDTVDLWAVLSRYTTTDQLRVGPPSANGGQSVYRVVEDKRPPVINLPSTFLKAVPGESYTLSAEVRDNKGVASAVLNYTISGTGKTAPMTLGTLGKYEYVIPGSEITPAASQITFTITATDVTGLTATSTPAAIEVELGPRITSVQPAAGSTTGEDKRPGIAVTVENAGEFTAALTLTDKNGDKLVLEEPMTVSGSQASYAFSSDLADGRYTAKVTVTRSDSAAISHTWSFTVGESSLKAYFGQLHSHTAEYSDGSGTLADGLNYIKNIPDTDNVQFVAFTDHSNYFDTTTAANPEGALGDLSLATAASKSKWSKYTGDMRSFNDQANGVLAVPGFEMTWSGGPGHINTFNTEGIVSRNNSTLNNKTGDAGLKAYYSLLKQNPESVSQFNHPGTTFGTFADFAYLDPAIDELMPLIEVGNGEGAVGSSGYFPSYDYYVQALDRGWHVAPTNNQDNHKGQWGNSNTARTVILTEDFSEEGLLQGMRDRSLYATEDKNLSISFTVNDELMGSIINDKPESINLRAIISDPDDTKIGMVEVVVNGGRVIHQEDLSGSTGELNLTLAPEYSYYFLRVIQADKDIAVTAPVWVGEVVKTGITGITTTTVMPVKGEDMSFTTKLFNYEAKDLVIEKLEYSITHLGQKYVIETLANPGTVPSATDAKAYSLTYTPDKIGFVTLTVTVEAKLGDTAYTFESSTEFEVLDPEDVVPIAIDGGHSNFYVTGNYPNSDANFIEMAGRSGVRVVRLGAGELTYDNLKDKALLILTVPFVSFGTSVASYLYTDAEIAAIKQYADNGGNIVLCSKSDRGDPSGQGEQASVISNELLEAIGAKARVAEGIVVDSERRSNESYRITLGGETDEDQLVFNYTAIPENKLAQSFLKEVKETTNNKFSAYNSAPILANGSVPLVSGFPLTTWGTRYADLQGDKYLPKENAAVVTPLGQTHLMTAETLPGGGFAIVAGVTFFSTFEVKIEVDNANDKQNSNYQLVQNILDSIKPEVRLTDIDQVHQAEEGERFTIQGTATSNASGYDRTTAFFDCIYVQDLTGGINVFPVSGNIQAGQTVRITGYVSSYLGERQLQAGYVETVDANISPLPAPKEVTTAEAAQGAHLGSLVKISGTVVSYTAPNNVVESILVKDASGTEARVFVDGYITSTKTISNLAAGASITAVGLSSHDTEGYRIRVRDRDDIACTPAPGGENPPSDDDDDKTPSTPGSGSGTGTISTDASGDVLFAPKAVASNGKAAVSLDAATYKKLMEEALKASGTKLVITPQVTGEASSLSLRLPAETVSSLSTSLSLTFNTSYASITLPGKALAAIAGSSSKAVDLIVDKASDDAVTIRIESDGKTLSALSGGMLVRLPAAALPLGTVAVLVGEDGRETLLTKAYLSGDKLALLISGSATLKLTDNQKVYRDVSTGLEAYEAIMSVSALELFSGTGNNAFSPDTVLTRGMLAVLLHRLEGKPTTAPVASFGDVAAGTWYSEAIAWASSQKIVHGIGGSAFGPEQPLSRAELAAMLYRYAKGQALSTPDVVGEFRSYPDSSKVPLWAQEAMDWAVGAGLLNGTDKGQLAPLDPITRAETAEVLIRLIKLIVD